MAATALPPLPPQFKSIQHHLRTAQELDKREPVVAYYCEWGGRSAAPPPPSWTRPGPPHPGLCRGWVQSAATLIPLPPVLFHLSLCLAKTPWDVRRGGLGGRSPTFGGGARRSPCAASAASPSSPFVYSALFLQLSLLAVFEGMPAAWVHSCTHKSSVSVRIVLRTFFSEFFSWKDLSALCLSKQFGFESL